MRRISYWLRNLFGFSQREVNGFGVLTILLVLAITAPFLFGHLSAGKLPDASADKHKLDSLLIILNNSAAEKAIPETNPSVAPPEKWVFTAFNPNELSAEQWQAMGLQKMLAQRIINYQKKGGKFRTKADILKIYGFPADVYTRMEPFIQLPDTIHYSGKNAAPASPQKEKEIVVVKNSKAVELFDLNMADSAQLMLVKGIGPGLSRRILNYRNKLGGFYHENQLKEVYGLDSTVVAELLKYGSVNSPVLQKIPVNTATVQALDAHPYISPKVASLIVDYRKQHGPYTSLDNLYQIRALEKAVLDKLAPYLSFE